MRLLTLKRRQYLLFGLTTGLAISTAVLRTEVGAAPPDRPKPEDGIVAKLIHKKLPEDHISRRPMDNEISQRALPLFLEALDPPKLYFTQADADEFTQRRNDLDDMVKAGDLKFAYTVYQRLLQRARERVNLVDELLKQPLDFTEDDEIIVDPDIQGFPKDDAEVRSRWTKKIKYDLLVLKGQKIDGDKAKEKLSRRYHSLLKRFEQMDSDELLETFLTSVTASYDPHTSYMSATQLENFRILMGLHLEGIGAALSFEDGYTVVSHIIPGGAADKDGKLKMKDRIVNVGEGASAEAVDVVDMKLNDVVKRIRGKAGTTVRLGVIPEGDTETKVYQITRAKIELEDSAARGEIHEEGKKSNGQAYKTGVIDLPSFYMDMEAARENPRVAYRSTTRDVRKILEEFNTKSVDIVVIDLRRNGGGSLPEAINLTGLFIDQGPIVQVKDANGTVASLDDEDAGAVWSGPLVVITSKFSASASEIFAGAIQDYQRGLIVGDDSTHGKGTVQSLTELGQQLFRIPNPRNLGALKVTMQQFYRPNGDSTQKRGVLSDVVLPHLTNYMGESEGNLDYALEFDKTPPARYSKLALVNPDLVSKLNQQSAARRKESKDFQKWQKTIDQYRELKARKTIPLNEEKYFAQRAELDADKEEEKQFNDPERGKREVFKREFFNNEILSVAVDYLSLMDSSKVAVKR